MKSLEERISALEVAVKFQSQQLEEVKDILLELKDKIAERQTENGVQNSTLVQHEEDIKALAYKLEQIDGRVSNLSRFVYIAIGAVSAITFIVQLIIPLVR